jgi:K+-transporting ATPase ATPase B chain
MAKPRTTKLFDRAIVRTAFRDSFRKLDPRIQAANPVMFVVLVGAVLVTVLLVRDVGRGRDVLFNLQIALWLWFTLLFANFAEAMAEGRGKAQAAALRRGRTETVARRLGRKGEIEEVPAAQLRKGDRVVVEAGRRDPRRRHRRRRDRVGRRVRDHRRVRPGHPRVGRRPFGRHGRHARPLRSDRRRDHVESGRDLPRPDDRARRRRLASKDPERNRSLDPPRRPVHRLSRRDRDAPALRPLREGRRDDSRSDRPARVSHPDDDRGAALGDRHRGMDRVLQHNVLAMSGRAVEAAGDVNVLLLDKTGTITLGNRQATDFLPAPGVLPGDLAEAAQLSSLADETPEGRSIVVLAKEKFGLRGRRVEGMHFVPFSASTRMSGVDWNGRRIRKGAGDAIAEWVRGRGGGVEPAVSDLINRIASEGATPLLVADEARVLGVIALRDVVKAGMRDRFDRLRAMGIRTIMITGDNPLTASAIAREAGVDDFLAQATPEQKLALIRKEQEGGNLVAMTGDGTNDAPALAQADVGVAMNTGTQAAREAGNMVDLDSNPTKLIEIVEIGKQLLMTRGALTTFSISNDVAKYFAILPAMFAATYPALNTLNVMRLGTPQSAILSAVIFNALIIVALIPLALRGVRYRPLGAARILTRNLWIYGVGGIVVPFLGIKLIDWIVLALHLA